MQDGREEAGEELGGVEGCSPRLGGSSCEAAACRAGLSVLWCSAESELVLKHSNTH